MERLYLDEDITGMIKAIVEFQGIYPHDKLIVIPKDGSGYTVLEGNRRVLAVKSLLGIIKPPAKYLREVLSLSAKLSEKAKESIRHVGVVVYEKEDQSYLKIIADKHSSISYQRWGQIAQWHFFTDLYEANNKDLDLTANELGKNKSEVSNYIKFYSLFSYIRSLPYWDEKELRDQIESNALKATKFTRPLGIRDIQKSLKLNWNDKFEFTVPEEHLDTFNNILCKYAEASLLLDKSDDDFIYTRSTTEGVLELIQNWKDELNLNENPDSNSKKDLGVNSVIVESNNLGKEQTENDFRSNNKSDKKDKGTTKGTHKKPVKYFEDLKCSVENQRLKRLTTELVELSKNNRMEKFPAAGIMLTRSLFESCLLHLVENKNKKGDYYKSLEYEKDGKIFVTKEGLSNLVSFVLKEVNSLFKAKNVKFATKALQQVKASHLDTFNSIVHDTWLDPSGFMITGIAGDIRELLRAILTDDA